jgi:hypothetical protein
MHKIHVDGCPSEALHDGKMSQSKLFCKAIKEEMFEDTKGG